MLGVCNVEKPANSQNVFEKISNDLHQLDDLTD